MTFQHFIQNYHLKLADCFVGQGDHIPEKSAVICSSNENAINILDQIKNCPAQNYVLITRSSDYGISYLNEKTAKYGITMHGRILARFNDLPPNLVKWFSTHCDVDETNIEGIPLGMTYGINPGDFCFYQSAEKHLKDHIGDLPNDTLYINWTDGTNFRKTLRERHRNDAATVTSHGLSFDDYVEDMIQYGYVLSPPGLGLDTYRTMEALSVGRMPIVFNERINNAYDNIPIMYDDFINGARLNKTIQYSGTKLDFTYWINTINILRQQL